MRAQRIVKSKADGRASTRDCAWLCTSRPPGGRSPFPVRHKQRNKSPLIPPAPPAARTHSLQSGLVLEPGTQASLPSGSTDPSWEGEEGRGAKAPRSVPRPGQDRPPHSSPGSRPRPRHGQSHTQANGAVKKGSKEGQRRVEAAPRAARSPEGQPPCTVHPCSTPTSCPKRAPPSLGSSVLCALAPSSSAAAVRMGTAAADPCP